MRRLAHLVPLRLAGGGRGLNGGHRGQPLSYDGAIPAVNHWPGQHPMVEYILLTGSGYYGFYYSPDDVPLAFQNVPVPLEETSTGWQCQAEGDDHGFTYRLSPGWYYFEVHF